MNSENRRVVDTEVVVNDVKVPETGRIAATKRLQKELMQIVLQSDETITAFPDGDNLFRWIATITGPKDTVFDGLKFKVLLTFSVKYPFCAPIVVFLNHCFHPNISSDGDICLDILKDKWTALYDVRTVLISIQSLLGEPNLDSPLDSHAAQMWGHEDYRQLVLDKYRKSVNDSTKSK